MERRSILASDIGIAQQQHGDDRKANDCADAGVGTPKPLSSNHGRSVSEAPVVSQVGFGVEGKFANMTPTCD